MARCGEIEGRSRQLESDGVAVREGWPRDWTIESVVLISLVRRREEAAAQMLTLLSIWSAERRDYWGLLDGS